jgi:hypothetical protein
MKKILIIAALATSIAAPIASTANAGWTSQTIGSMTFIRGTGSNSGQRTTCQNIGTMTFCN